MRLLIATTNPHKARELKGILSGIPALHIITPKEISGLEPVEEDGKSLKENAIKKAVSYARQSGLMTVADDSGLCVDVLGGAPGVLSARFAGEEQNAHRNCEKLLKVLKGVPREKRSAGFECWIALADPEALIATFSGSVKGIIIEELRGKNGFGYDPLFLYPELNQTFAEIPADLKNRISHRALALVALRKELPRYLTGRKKPLDK
ncbi:MAG: RdgB/HAM1 family non-canonical purine NTP pyrophosphatase [Candidatus Omnitrophica bacterium]|nr:RdgB/HAM1 family non-canonical purine NTP pyrophosphatase [Candidatus Omnitrophota bacterium]